MKETTKNSGKAPGNGDSGKVCKTSLPGKGKQDANLPKNGLARFQIRLIMALILVLLVFEIKFKTSDVQLSEPSSLDEIPLEYYAEQDILNLEKPKIQPSHPIQNKINPEDFTVVPDDEPFLDRPEVIAPDNNPPVNVGSIQLIEVDPELEEINFELVEEVPVFPGCEEVAKEHRKLCFAERMQQHIRKHVRYPEAEQEIGVEGKVFVTFKIDVDGSVYDVQVHGPTKGLEDEAGRIIGKLPVMTPGKQRGKPVRVPFSIPINFQLQK